MQTSPQIVEVPPLTYKETMKGIEVSRNAFFHAVSSRLNLQRVAAPLFIPGGTGYQDTLFKTDALIKFEHRQIPGAHFETLHSLAKWKRHILTTHEYEAGTGIYCEGHYVRGHEPELDQTHSIYVLQFDWEQTLRKEDRTLDYLKQTVTKIYEGLKEVEEAVVRQFPQFKRELPENIVFVHSEDLEHRFPDLTSKEREVAITKEHGAVFLIGIGHPLPKSGSPHDDRAADYDDWWTANG